MGISSRKVQYRIGEKEKIYTKNEYRIEDNVSNVYWENIITDLLPEPKENLVQELLIKHVKELKLFFIYACIYRLTLSCFYIY